MSDLQLASHTPKALETGTLRGTAESFGRGCRPIKWLALLAICLVGGVQLAADAQSHTRFWTFAVAPAVNDDASDSGLMFSFESPCATNALVTVAGTNDGKAFETATTGIQTTPQRADDPGSNLLRLPGGVKSAETLKIDMITMTVGRDSRTWRNPTAGASYAYCGDR